MTKMAICKMRLSTILLQISSPGRVVEVVGGSVWKLTARGRIVGEEVTHAHPPPQPCPLIKPQLQQVGEGPPERAGVHLCLSHSPSLSPSLALSLGNWEVVCLYLHLKGNLTGLHHPV